MVDINSPADIVRQRLADKGCEPSKLKSNGRFDAKCPAHTASAGSRNRTLSGRVTADGKVLLRCHWGEPCPVVRILHALDLQWPDLFPRSDYRRSAQLVDVPGRIVATYPYCDEYGTVLYETVRRHPKSFQQRRPDGAGWVWNLDGVRRVPYRLPEVLEATTPDPRVVVIVEGEHDADTVAALGVAATTNVGGAGKWRDEYGQYLHRRLCDHHR